MDSAGVWSEARQYTAGQFCTHDGALWHADKPSQGVKPGTSAGIWRLAVKKGGADKEKGPTVA